MAISVFSMAVFRTNVESEVKIESQWYSVNVEEIAGS